MTGFSIFRRSHQCLAMLLIIMLAGCQNLPNSLSGATLLGTPRIEPLAPLPPAPDTHRQWPDTTQDVINQRAVSFGLVHMPHMQAYLNQLLQRIKTAAGHPDWPGTVHILAATTPDAYATRAGNIYVSQAWLQNIQSEDEIVALLAHEFGHIYLHYHQLEGAVQATDTMAALGLAGIALANKTDISATPTEWNALSAALVGYALSRSWLSAAWSRAHESAADSFGLNISLKLGYSYQAGYKPLLERLSTWQTMQEAEQATRKAALFEAVKQQAAAEYLKRQGSTNSQLNNPLSEVHGAFAGMIHQAGQAISTLLQYGARQHPDIDARIDALATLVDAHGETIYDRPATLAPWQNTIRQRTTATILKHYELAAQALAAPHTRIAMQQATQSVQGPTATHALPLLARYSTLSSQQPSRSSHANLLAPNLRSTQNRAWFMYITYAEIQQRQGQTRNALTSLQQGLRHFGSSEQAWTQAIRLTGQMAGWPQAKALASACAKQVPKHAASCEQAAQSPSEQSTGKAAGNRATTDSLLESIKGLLNG